MEKRLQAALERDEDDGAWAVDRAGQGSGSGRKTAEAGPEG